MKSLIASLCLYPLLCLASGKPPIRISDGNSAAASPPLLTVRNYTYSVKDKELGVLFQLEKGDARKLAEISRQYVGKKLSFAVGDSQVSTPKMLDAIQGDGIWLTFQDRGSLESLKKTLTGE